VRSLGYNEGEGVSELVEYEVNPDPLGPCPFEEDCMVVESPTQYLCARQLKLDQQKNDRAESGAGKANGDAPDDASDALPKGCGFVLPRTVCKREITRDEAEVYLKNGKTDILEEFTSRFGRPFSATLTLKENGRHGFEFPPRKARGAAAGDDTTAGAAPRKKTTEKKTTKKATSKKTTAKKATAKKATAKKRSKKKTTKKKATRKSAATKKNAPT